MGCGVDGDGPADRGRRPGIEFRDGVYVLNSGGLNWGDETQPWQAPLPGRRTVRHIEPLQGRSILPMMTLHLQSLLG